MNHGWYIARLSWLVAPFCACLLLVLITLAALHLLQRQLTLSEVAKSGVQPRVIAVEEAGNRILPGAVGHGVGFLDSNAESLAGTTLLLDELNAGLVVEHGPEPFRYMYQLARNLIITFCAVALAMVVWLTLRRRRNRKRLAERDVLYHQVLDHLPLMVRIRDVSGQVKLENKLTLSSEIAQWGSLGLQDATHDPKLPPLSRAVWETQRGTLQTGTPQERFFETGDVEDAAYRAYRLISFPIYDAKGHSHALGSLALEETAQARDRHALASLAADLERQVHERTAELMAAKEQAEAAAQAKTKFLANMSHEIRSPLNALVGLSHLARRSNLDPQLENYLGKILKSAEHLQNVVGDILDFSKIEAGEMKVERVSFSLQRLMDSVVDIVWERARGKPLQLILDVDPQLPGQFYGDPLRIVQILINFMDNAIKFTERGNISLRVLLGEMRGPNYQLHFEVQDSGVGIPTERLDEVFKPFQQLDDSITRRYGGTGLGLAICAQLTTLLGGQLTARSELGVGSLFRLSLELEIAAGSDDPGDVCVDALKGLSVAGRHVLLVEDDALNREVATEQLSALGLRVLIAENGADALQCLSNDSSVELVLMDVQMPVMDGLEAIRRLRPNFPDLPVIAMTANNLPGDRERCLQAGMSDYLPKPIDPMHLEALLERWLCRAPEYTQSEPASTGEGEALSAIAGLDQEAALARLLGNHELYLSLLSRFVDDYADVAQDLHDSLEHERFEEAQEVLHRFKSLAGTLGAERLQALSTELELSLREGHAWAGVYDSFASEFTRMLQAVKAALASP